MELKTRNIDGKEQVFCSWRKKWVRLTPEEWVRQQFLLWLVREAHYPPSRIAVEQAIRVAQVQKRCDAVVYDKQLRAVCIIEFKAETVALTQKVFDQIAVYNRALQVEYLILANGKEMYVGRVKPTGIEFLEQFPLYEQICQRKSLN